MSPAVDRRGHCAWCPPCLDTHQPRSTFDHSHKHALPNDPVPLRFEDERTDDKVRCRICGKWVPFEKSRLFYSNGTFRTCEKGDRQHEVYS